MDILSIFLSKLAIFVIITMAEPELLAKEIEIQDYTDYNYEWNSEFSSTGTESDASPSLESENEDSDESWYSVSSYLADDYISDVDEVLQHIKNENQIISDEGKTWSEVCRKPPKADLCDRHPYEMLRACVDMADKITSNRDGYEFTFRYMITGDGIKCEELSVQGIEDHITRPMYQCPNMSIQTDLDIIRLPIFYLSQSCQGDNLYAFRRTGDYKLAKVMGEWTQYPVKPSPSDIPAPPAGVWLLYNYNKQTTDRSPASVIKATTFKYEE